MKIFKTWRDPYELGYSTCRPRQVQINEGITVLVGCNGAGKSTLLRNIAQNCREDNVPVMIYDNETDSDRFSDHIMHFAMKMQSSEGENITHNLAQVAPYIREFIVTGYTPKSKLQKAFDEIFDESKHSNTCVTESRERFLLLDAIDSGYSIDNVIELKSLFHLILDESCKYDLTTYIIVSANEYELVNGERCFDVMKGNYVTFRDYKDYRKFILSSRQNKDKKIKAAQRKREKREHEEGEKRNEEGRR